MSLRDTIVPDIFERDRPFHWNALGALLPESEWDVGNEWEHFADDDGSLICEDCGSVRGMIVNDPFDPETPVDFDSPVQVLCSDCAESSLPIDSPYRSDNTGTSMVEIDPEGMDDDLGRSGL